MTASNIIEEARNEVYEVAEELAMIGELLMEGERFPSCASSFGAMLARKAEKLHAVANGQLVEGETLASRVERACKLQAV